MVKEYTEEEREKYLKSNLTLYGNSRAMYSVRFNNAQLDVDVEDALSQIIQYMYYLCFKTRDDLYANVPVVAQRFIETKSMSVLAVGFLSKRRGASPNLPLGSKLFHGVAYSWTSNCTGNAWIGHCLHCPPVPRRVYVLCFLCE